jgi:hypothetical protein
MIGPLVNMVFAETLQNQHRTVHTNTLFVFIEV